MSCVLLVSFVSSKEVGLKEPRFLVGIPQIYHFGAEGLHNILVIDVSQAVESSYGMNLNDLSPALGTQS
jgi:hypothetical protein